MSGFYAEPRISATVEVHKDWKINAAWGIYNQFINKTAVVDSTINYSYFWTAANNQNIPVLTSQHWVGGLSYDNNNLTINVEGYLKNTEGMTWFVSGTDLIERGYYTGRGRSYGIDFFVKKSFKDNLVWLAYTLSKSEEQFSFFQKPVYRPALHDQRHELKLAGILNIKSFYFSTNYVFGSGFERTAEILG